MSPEPNRTERRVTALLHTCALGPCLLLTLIAAPVASAQETSPSPETSATASDSFQVDASKMRELREAAGVRQSGPIDYADRLKQLNQNDIMVHPPVGAKNEEEAHILNGDKGAWAQLFLALRRGRWDLVMRGPAGYLILVLAVIGGLSILGRLFGRKP